MNRMDYILLIYEKDSKGKTFYTDVTIEKDIRTIVDRVVNINPKEYKAFIGEDITSDIELSIEAAKEHKTKEERRKLYLQLKEEFEE